MRPAPPSRQVGGTTNTTLTAVDGLKVGSVTLTERPTGCTVILVDGEARPAASSQRGGAPGTRETDLLNPLNMVDKVNAIVLSGGSAFGLDAATGTVQLARGAQHRLGRADREGADRAGGDPVRPAASAATRRSARRADCGYKAVEAATTAPVAEGTVGAGAGATVGKMGGPGALDERRASAAPRSRMPNGLVVAAIVAVNAVGDIIDPDTGKVVAGVRKPDGTFADARTLLRSGALAGAAGRAPARTRRSASSPPTRS